MTTPAATVQPPSTAKKSISLPSELLDSAVQRAKSEQRTLSSYIQSLIAKDLETAERGCAAKEAA